jgi:putative DNA methylase
MFCSYKGDGTGAVRPIFSNHILKHEMMPLENTVWRTGINQRLFIDSIQNPSAES